MKTPLPHAVFSGPPIWEDFEVFLHDKGFLNSKIFILVDSHTHEHCLPVLLGHCGHIADIEILEIEPGEASKCLEITQQLWAAMAELGAHRKTLLINLGGGMISDLGGFIASTYMRGIPFVNIPTSLLAMVDAAWGGKTGIDFLGLKNQIGTFNFPEAICLSPEFLETLPERELLAGFAEIIKHGLIADAGHFYDATALLETGFEEFPLSLLEKSVTIKAKIVAADAQEKNQRMLLNAGHTIGHALESFGWANNCDWLHGEAVAAGLLCEAFVAHQKEMIALADLQTITQTIVAHFPCLPFDAADFSAIMNVLKQDKKSDGAAVKTPLLTAIGQSEIVTIQDFEVFYPALEYYIKCYA